MTGQRDRLKQILLLLTGLALVTSGVVSAQSLTDQGYWGDRERGWFWGEVDPKEEETTPKVEPEPPRAKAPETTQTARERLEALREEVEEAKALAILEPTEENVSAYMAIQKEMMDKSAVFADVWQRAMWENPGLGYSADKPIAGDGMRERRRVESAEVDQAIAEVRETRGLFFFYSSPESCPYCGVQSRHVSRFAENNDLTVQAVSLDGSANEYFPNARPDNGIAEALGVKQVPALFLVDPETRQVDSLGYGVITDTTIGQRMRTILVRDLGEF